MSTGELCRLHITPFAPDLLRAIIPASLTNVVQNISYHTIQSSAESCYGYVDLPKMQADKIKKKLNGAILKGKKIKVEEARPKKRRHAQVEEEEQTLAPPTLESTTPKSKKPKRDLKTISGHELPPDRKIKRGWTEPKSEKTTKSKKDKGQRPASKYSEKEELIFRTKIPPNRTEAANKMKRKERSKAGNDVVHEFEKSTLQPSFLRSGANSGRGKSTEYVDGKGWVDEDGEVIEAEIAKPKNAAAEPTRSRLRSAPKVKAPSSESRSNTSESDSDSSSEAEEAQYIHSQEEEAGDGQLEDTEETSSSGSTSESEVESNSEHEETSRLKVRAEPKVTRTETSSEGAQEHSEVHPLEALFKKPGRPASEDQDVAKPSLELQTSFSFFDPNNDDDDVDADNEATIIPGTPYSSQDIRSRDLRSAAPTPDTAHPSRFSSYNSNLSQVMGLDDDDDADSGGDEERPRRNETPTASSSKSGQSDFEKLFWEKRGENNRAWKQRRRETLKEKRQKENRARKNRNW